MDQNPSPDSTRSGSNYRPYYSYASDLHPSEAVSDKHPIKTEAEPIKPATSPPPAAAPAPRPPMKKKSNRGVLVAFVVFFGVMLLIAVLFAAALGTPAGTPVSTSGKIAVIHINGQMYTGDYQYGSGYAGSDAICRHIRNAADNSSVKAIVLRIDSPGGSGSCSQEIAEEIRRAQGMGKPVVTSMGDYAASAAYYVASQTDYIYATPATYTGSIGVYSVHYDQSEAYDDAGINVTLIKSGDMKDMGADFRPMTNEEKKYAQKMVNDMYNIFVDDVARGRNMTRADVLVLADGRVYTGQDAKENGLIDDFGNLYNAADKAAELAGLKSYTLSYPDQLTVSSLLF